MSKKKYTKSELLELAVPTFGRYDREELYATSDGNVFVEKVRCEEHARSLKENPIVLNRADLPTKPAAEEKARKAADVKAKEERLAAEKEAEEDAEAKAEEERLAAKKEAKEEAPKEANVVKPKAKSKPGPKPTK